MASANIFSIVTSEDYQRARALLARKDLFDGLLSTLKKHERVKAKGHIRIASANLSGRNVRHSKQFAYYVREYLLKAELSEAELKEAVEGSLVSRGATTKGRKFLEEMMERLKEKRKEKGGEEEEEGLGEGGEGMEIGEEEEEVGKEGEEEEKVGAMKPYQFVTESEFETDWEEPSLRDRYKRFYGIYPSEDEDGKILDKGMLMDEDEEESEGEDGEGEGGEEVEDARLEFDDDIDYDADQSGME